MKNIFIGALAALMTLVSCSSEQSIPYKEAHNYFLRNDVKTLPNGQINSQAELESLFGMAAHMGKDGLPTAINFANEFAIAATVPATDLATEMSPRSLKRDGKGNLIFTYRLRQGEKQSYTTQPSLLIIVNRKYEGNVVVRQE